MGEQCRRIFKVGPLGGHFGDTRFDDGNLGGRALLAILPVGALGHDRLHAAVGEFGLARQRLRLGTHLRCEPAMALDVGANGGKPRLGVVGWRQFGQCGSGALVRGFSFAAIGGEAGVGFGQRRSARGVAVDFALGGGMAFARGIGLALRGPPGLAGGRLGGGRRLQFGLGVFQRLPLGGGVGAGLFQFVFDIDKPRPFGETPGGAGRGVGGRDKTVPAPDVALQRHQPLAGLQLRHQLRAALLRHDADLRQTSRQFGRRLDMGGEGFDAIGQGWIVEARTGIGPAQRRGRIDGRVEIVAEHGAERLFIAFGDGDAVDDRRPEVLGFAVDEL